MNRKVSILITFCILIVILFDAFQQKFYLDTFNLHPSEPITFIELLGTHSLRWSIWFIFNLLAGLFIWNSFLKINYELKPENWLLFALIALFINLAALTSVALLNLSLAGSESSMQAFTEHFTFMLVQKGLSFTFASTLLMLFLFNLSKSRLIDAQWIEIKNLKQTNSNGKTENSNPTIRIKIGQKHKLIHLSEVIWFEADDYCVRIHTQSKIYSLRKSLKSLERELETFQFIRVHRKALLNMNYFSEVNYQAFTVRLNNQSELPLSKSGAANLRAAIAANSI